MADSRISGVSPRFFADERDVADLYAEFGPHNGRFLAELPKQWLAEAILWAKESDADVSLLKMQKLKEKLRRMGEKGYFVQSEGSEFSKQDWGAAFRATITADNYEFVIGDFLDAGEFETWDSDLLERVRENRRRTRSFQGNWQNVMRDAKPLILTAHTIYLVDPYFDPLLDDEHWKLVTAILDLSRKTKFTKLSFVSSAVAIAKAHQESPLDVENLEAVLTDRLSGKLKPGLRVHWHLLPKQHKFIEMHDRFFLTDKGAISLGKGFAHTRKPSSTLAFLDEAHHKDLSSIYMEPLDLSRTMRECSQRTVGVFKHVGDRGGR